MRKQKNTLSQKHNYPIKFTIKVVIIMLLVLCFTSTPLFSFDSTKDLYVKEKDESYYLELNDMPVMTQETGFTCFVVSMAIIRNHFNLETTENGLLSELDILNCKKGMLPSEYLLYANRAFKPLSYSVNLINPTEQKEIIDTIVASLTNELPVIFFYSTIDDWNKPNYNTHYGVIYGINIKTKMIKISNPYGYLEEISYADLFDGLSFQNYEQAPFLFRLGRLTGYIKTNSIFTLESI